VAKDAVLVSDGNRAYEYELFTAETGITQMALVARQAEWTLECYHIQNVNAYQGRFKSWLARFKGVASKYPPSRLGCRRMIERPTYTTPLPGRHHRLADPSIFKPNRATRLAPAPSHQRPDQNNEGGHKNEHHTVVLLGEHRCRRGLRCSARAHSRLTNFAGRSASLPRCSLRLTRPVPTAFCAGLRKFRHVALRQVFEVLAARQ
jgi:hypothetical protein